MAEAQDNSSNNDLTGNFNDWLNQPIGPKKSLLCQTCAYGEKVCELIRQFMIARAEGKTRRPNRDLHDYLTAPENGINYHLGESALNTHMRRCEKDLHSRMRNADVENGLARGHQSDLSKPTPKKSAKKRATRKKGPKDE